MHNNSTVPTTDYFCQDDERAETEILKDQVIVTKDNIGKSILGIMANIILWPPLHWMSNLL